MAFAPNPAPNGTQVDVTASVSDLNTSNQTIGSVQLTAPAGFTIVSSSTPNATISGNTITFNYLSIAPGTSSNIDVTVETPSACGTYNWTASARQANQFNSGGNVINPSPTSVPMAVGTVCSLKFITEPHSVIDALPGTPSDAIGGAADFAPPPPGVEVQLYDANGNPVGAGMNVTIGFAPGGNPSMADLGGSAPVMTDANGIATFDALTVDQIGIGYELQASADGASAVSTSFDAVSNGTLCISGKTCQIEAGNSFSNSQVVTNPTSSGNDGGTLFELVNGFGGKQLVCPGYDSLDENTFDVVMGAGVNTRSWTWTETIYDVAATQSAAANVKASVQVCFGDTARFTNSKNKPAASGTLPDGTQGYIDLLPNCPQKNEPCHDRALDSSQRDPNGPGFDLTVVAQIPPGFDALVHN